jgi:hypothetical protein
MFEDSTKIIVISSSHIKGVGPRIGSIGYAAPHRTNKITFLPQQTQFVNGLVLFTVRVSFIRYGYEKERPKYEVKELIGAIPIINELKKNDETENILRTYIERLPRTNFDSHLWLKTKLDLLNRTDNVNVCVLVPINANDSDLRTCSDVEFVAWFKSLMFKEQTKASIYKIVSNRTYLNRLPIKDLIYIGDNFRFYFRSKRNEGAFINHILGSSNRRRDLIRFLKIVKPIYSKGILSDHKEVISRLLTNSKFVYKRGARPTNMLFCKLVNYMFIDNIINWKLDVLKKSRIVKNRNSIAAKIKKTREVLGSMANEINNK